MGQLWLTRKAYRDKVEGGWLGRSAGNTLGFGVAGRMEAHAFTYYDPVPGQPAASEELDLQIAALGALRSVGPGLTGAELAQIWVDRIGYTFDEVGYARRNLRRGLRPPISGAFDNWFRRSSSAANRTLLWAMAAPGTPQLACAYAFEDARIDHSDEGVWAALFWAALQSAAFFVCDVDRLLDVGCAMLPSGSRVAQAVRAARDAHAAMLGWLDARTRVLKAVGHPNYSDAAQNVGFGVIGLLYGGGDFGASVCAAVNCGYDSDGVGAAVGGALGILHGRSGLPAEWIAPLGEGVVVGWGLADAEVERTVGELAAHTVEAGERVLAERDSDVLLVDEAPQAEADDGRAALASVAEPAAEPAAEPVAVPPAAAESAAEPAAGPEPPADLSEGAAPVAETRADVRPTVEPAAPAHSAETAAGAEHDWTANSLVRSLLAQPANTSTHHEGPFEVVVDYGDAGPAIVPNVATTLMVTVRNLGSAPFVGYVQVSAPKGWEVRVPGAQGQRQMLAAGGMSRYGFVVRAPDTAPMASSNDLALVLAPESGQAVCVEFALLGGAGWYVVGPFKNQLEDGFERACEPEDRPGLDSSYLGRAGGLVRWTRMAFKETVMDVEPLFEGQPGVLYARTRYHVPTRTDCRVVLHTNDGGKVWLNGRLVLQRHWHAPFRPTLGDGPCMADVTLNAGDNDLMLKVVRCREPAELALMLTDRRGEPLEGYVGAWL